MDKEMRRESSVPVASRVSIVDLAKMDLYWRRVENTHIKSMSQLVSWTFAALVEIVEKNGKMPEEVARDVLSAHKYLEARGLYQRSLRKRSEGKIVTALGFENLRRQGVDPAVYSPSTHKMIHSEHSVKPFDGEVEIGNKFVSGCGINWDEVDERVAEEKVKERDTLTKETIEAARASGMIVDVVDGAKKIIAQGEGLRRKGGDKECDAWEKDVLERDKKRIALENAPLKPEDFDLVKE